MVAPTSHYPARSRSVSQSWAGGSLPPPPPPPFLYRTRKTGRSNFCLLSWLRRVTENKLFKGAVSIWLSESAGFTCRPLKPAPEARHSHPIRGKSTRELSNNEGHEFEARLSYTAKLVSNENKTWACLDSLPTYVPSKTE